MKSPKKIVVYITRLAINAIACLVCCITLHYLFEWLDSRYVLDIREAKHYLLATLGVVAILEQVAARTKRESKFHKATSVCRRIAFSSNVLFFGYMLINSCNECDKWLTFLSLSIGAAIMLEVDRLVESKIKVE